MKENKSLSETGLEDEGIMPGHPCLLPALGMQGQKDHGLKDRLSYVARP